MKRVSLILLAISLTSASHLLAEQNHYFGSIVTGLLSTPPTVVNLTQLAQQVQTTTVGTKGSETKPFDHPGPYAPPVTPILSAFFGPTVHGMPVNFSGAFGFNALSHADQRLANNGNQFSTEPATPGIAVANGYVLEGVDNAVMVYSTAGVPLLAQAVSSNQLFNVSAAINRTTGFNGVYPTDMRVFYDKDIDRFFVLEWSQANDASGNPLQSSREWIAVSQTGDPTGNYTIYSMDTTNAGHSGCPCFPDYPQIGADQYGIYISANEFNTFSQTFVDATILALNKAAFGPNPPPGPPTAVMFTMTRVNGYEFSIKPAVTPPDGSYYLASGGLEYFVSTVSQFSVGSSLAVWAMSNTSSLATNTPSLVLTQTSVSTETYVFPNAARQRSGTLVLGPTLGGSLSFLDGGDQRLQSLIYAGGRLYATAATGVTDELGNRLVGGAYFILSPVFRGSTLAATVLRQGYLAVTNNNLLRSVVTVNGQGNGAIVFTLVGPDNYPSAAFVPISTFSTGSTIQIAETGFGPEDGFTGYPGSSTSPVSRWGDSAVGTVSADGSIWMAVEYIPSAPPRTPSANWGTYVTKYKP